MTVKPSIPITIEEYVKAAQAVINTYPAELLGKLFGNKNLTVSIHPASYILDSTGVFWTKIAPIVYELKEINLRSFNEMGDLACLQEKFPTLVEWEKALHFCIKSLIARTLE